MTLESLLLPARVEVVVGRDWFFCDSPDCDVVYFTGAEPGESGETRVRADLSVRVGVKERAAPRPLCYCFGHTAESIADEIERTGASTVVASVSAHVKAGDCACETKNPSGGCCLGALRREVAEASARAALSEPASDEEGAR